MADYDAQKQRLTLKLVYYGPAMSGKTTNLMRLHDLLDPARTGELMSLETRNDRTLFFDLLPLGFLAASGLRIVVKLFTVPGQVMHNGTRKAVLSRADGVVFVADSQVSQGVNNGESFENLEDNVYQVGLDFETLPLVVQFNKRDLPNIVAEDELRARWAATSWPLTFASALDGAGVLATFRALLTQAYPGLDARYGLAERHGASLTQFVQSLAGEPHASESL